MQQKTTMAPSVANCDSPLVREILSWKATKFLDCDMFKNEIKQLPKIHISKKEYSQCFNYPMLEEIRSCICNDFKSERQSEKKFDYLTTSGNLRGYTGSKKCCIRINTGVQGVAATAPEVTTEAPIILSGTIVYVAKSHKNGPGFLATITLDFNSLTKATLTFNNGEQQDIFLKEKGNGWLLFILYGSNVTTLKRAEYGLARFATLEDSPLTTAVLGSLTPSNAFGAQNEQNFNDDEKKIMAGRNDSQRQAILAMLRGAASNGTVLNNHGPPGTGKTATLVTGILMLLQRSATEKQISIHASAPTNLAIVGLAERTLLQLEEHGAKTLQIRDLVIVGHLDSLLLPPKLLLIHAESRAEVLINGSAGWVKNLAKLKHSLKSSDPKHSHKLDLAALEECIICGLDICESVPSSLLSLDKLELLRIALNELNKLRSAWLESSDEGQD